MKTMNVFDCFSMDCNIRIQTSLSSSCVNFVPARKLFSIIKVLINGIKRCFLQQKLAKIAEIFNTLRFGVIISGHHVRSE